MSRVWAAGLALVLGVPGAAAASPDTLFVAPVVHPAVVRIGERVQVDVAVPLPPGTRLEGPRAPLAQGALDIVVSEPAATGPDSAGWRFEVAFFEPGEVMLAGLPLQLIGGGETRPVQVLPFRVTVETTLSDTAAAAGIRDIRSPVEYPDRWRWGRVIAALLLGALAAAALIWWWRRRRDAEDVRYERPELNPETEAQLALRTLETEALVARGKLKEHYARLSLILRRYVERRTGLPAVESTTYEIREAIDGGAVRGLPSTTEFVDMLEVADLVKFARHEVPAEAAGDALARGRDWVAAAAAVLVPRTEAPDDDVASEREASG